MPNIVRWTGEESWSTWTRQGSGVDPRIVDGLVKIPYNRISHIGSGDPGTEADTSGDTTIPSIAG
ncbi:MAG: hypothetical protein KAH23_09615, partial [Kiritimatiellae bacterium]|nr:hypothetical protein [Kiritimatiellia bacterium]